MDRNPVDSTRIEDFEDLKNSTKEACSVYNVTHNKQKRKISNKIFRKRLMYIT